MLAVCNPEQWPEMSVNSGNMAGRRILVVEDEALLAILIEETLQDQGCIIIGPTGKLSTALQMASDETLDAAVLDVTIRGGKVYPVAEQLAARGIPFVLASGYGRWALPEALRDRPHLAKPFSVDSLLSEVRGLVAG
jgi:CheY-like chemotaxis protein